MQEINGEDMAEAIIFMVKYSIGDLVVLKADVGLNARVVLGYNYRSGGVVKYALGFGHLVSEHYSFEIEGLLDDIL